MRVARLPGVFRPRSDTWLLAAALRRQPQLRGGAVLDVCTGSGALAVAAALAGARSATAVDVSRRAVLTARLNARLNGVRVEALRGDLLAAVRARRGWRRRGCSRAARATKTCWWSPASPRPSCRAPGAAAPGAGARSAGSA